MQLDLSHSTPVEQEDTAQDIRVTCQQISGVDTRPKQAAKIACFCRTLLVLWKPAMISGRELHMQTPGYSLRVHDLDGCHGEFYSVGKNGKKKPDRS